MSEKAETSRLAAAIARTAAEKARLLGAMIDDPSAEKLLKAAEHLERGAAQLEHEADLEGESRLNN
jgi:hypothetical protein